ncbi:hypothetical protein D9M68_569180 [compost metagenome]
MRHLRQVGDDRPATDVVAQRQGHRRLGVVVLAGLEHLGEAHDLPVFVGNLDADGGLAGDHFHHAHADHRQRAGQVLGQVGNAADLDAGRGLDLETGDHRAGMHGFDDDFDTELLELDLQQARHGLQRLGREALLLLLGTVEDGNRRQGTLHRAVDEQRCLLLLQHALARLDSLRCLGRGDLHRRALLALAHVLAQRLFALDQALLDPGLLAAVRHHRGGDLADPRVHLAQLGDQLLALGAGAPPAVGQALDQLDQVEGDLAGQVHHLEPGQIGEYGQAEQEQRDEQQGAALHVQRPDGQLPQAFAQRTAGRRRHAGTGMEMDVGQRGAREHQEHQADHPPGEQPATPLPGLMAGAEHLPGLHRQQQRKHVGEVAQDHEQDVGEPGAGAPGSVLHLLDVAGVGPTRIALVVGQQRHPQIEAQRAEGDQRPFLESVRQLLTPGWNLDVCVRFLQNACFPALIARPTDEDAAIVRLYP